MAFRKQNHPGKIGIGLFTAMLLLAAPAQTLAAPGDTRAAHNGKNGGKATATGRASAQIISPISARLNGQKLEFDRQVHHTVTMIKDQGQIIHLQ